MQWRKEGRKEGRKAGRKEGREISETEMLKRHLALLAIPTMINMQKEGPAHADF